MPINGIFLVLLMTFSLISSTSAQQKPAHPGPPVCYSVTDLGDVYDDGYKYIGLNAQGSVVGATLRWGEPIQGFEYNRGRVKRLPTLGGGSADPREINASGQIVGGSTLPNGLWHAVLWNHGKPIDLPTLGGGSSFAIGVNDHGDVAGSSAVLSLYDYHAAAWFKGKVVNLSMDGEIGSYANGINNLGQVAGSTNYPDGTWHGFIWKDGARTELPLPGGSVNPAFINNAGTVCGGASFPTGYHAFVYDGNDLIDLDPTSQWWWGYTNGLNDGGHAVGVVGGALGAHAFLRRNADEGMLDLNSTIPPDSGLTLEAAHTINAREQITARASMPDGTHAVLLTPMACSNHCAAAPSNMMAWWTGDGNAKDVAGGSHGTLRAGPSVRPGAVGTYKPGAVGMAFSLKGGGYVDVPDATNLNFTDAMTVDAWANANSFQPISAVVKKSDSSQANGYALEMSDSRMVFYVFLSTVGWRWAMSATSFAPNKWYHVAGTYDGSDLRLYVNGVLEDQFSLSDTITISTSNLNIGRDPSNPADTSRFWDGMIDEVQLFNRALSPAEILTIYQAGRKGVCKP